MPLMSTDYSEIIQVNNTVLSGPVTAADALLVLSNNILVDNVLYSSICIVNAAPTFT